MESQREPPRGSGIRFAAAGLLSVLLVAAAIGGLIAALSGSDDPPPGRDARTPGTRTALAGAKPQATPRPPKLPAQRTKNLAAAAKRAGCKLENPPDEGVLHEQREFTAADYRSNPPTSGTHYPDWYDDGIYAPGKTPNLGMLVHTLEHGRIDVQYAPGTPQATVELLKAFFKEQDGGYHMLLFQNTTGMKYAVAATAWDHLLGCPKMNGAVIDALRAFRARYIDKGPEVVP
jgi:Protein of unknown function (DUF3105)